MESVDPMDAHLRRSRYIITVKPNLTIWNNRRENFQLDKVDSKERNAFFTKKEYIINDVAKLQRWTRSNIEFESCIASELYVAGKVS